MMIPISAVAVLGAHFDLYYSFEVEMEGIEWMQIKVPDTWCTSSGKGGRVPWEIAGGSAIHVTHIVV